VNPLVGGGRAQRCLCCACVRGNTRRDVATAAHCCAALFTSVYHLQEHFIELSTPTPRYVNAAALLGHRVVAVGDDGDACRLCRPTDPSSPPRLSLLSAFHLMQGRVPPSRRTVNPLQDSLLDIARVLLQICQFVRGDDLDPDVVGKVCAGRSDAVR
jgi:hypothetical protein